MKKRKNTRSKKTGIKNKRQPKHRVSNNVTPEVLSLFIQKPDKNFTSQEIQQSLNKNTHSEKTEIVNVLRQLFSNGKIERTNSGGFCLNRD